MKDAFKQLAEIDVVIFAFLADKDAEPSLLAQHLQERKAILDELSASASSLDQNQWSEALKRSERLFHEIKQQRDEVAQHAHQLKKGRSSVQLYKKFQ